MDTDPYAVIRSILFRLDPETAHRLTLTMLPWVHRSGLLTSFLPRKIECPRVVMGLRFPNPVGLAAGLDKDGECFEAFEAMGFGFVELGTVTPRPQPGNPAPRMFRLPGAEALINRMGFNNQGVDALVERLRRRSSQKSPGIVGVNLGKNRDTPLERAVEDYLIGLRRVYPYADYVAINLSSPNTPHLRLLQNDSTLPRLLATLKEEQQHLTDEYGRRVPIALKIAPDLSPDEVEKIAHTLLAQEIDGVIATNTTIDRTAVAHLPHGTEEGGLSGTPLGDSSTAVIKRLSAVLGGRIPILGSGGILTPEDALAKTRAGASLVQVYTGLIYRGPALVAAIASALCAEAP